MTASWLVVLVPRTAVRGRGRGTPPGGASGYVHGEFQEALSPYGDWLEVRPFGLVWRPSASVVLPDPNPLSGPGQFDGTVAPAAGAPVVLLEYEGPHSLACPRTSRVCLCHHARSAGIATVANARSAIAPSSIGQRFRGLTGGSFSDRKSGARPGASVALSGTQ